MKRTTEYTREGGTHYIDAPKPAKKPKGVSEPQQEEQNDADESRSHRGEG